MPNRTYAHVHTLTPSGGMWANAGIYNKPTSGKSQPQAAGGKHGLHEPQLRWRPPTDAIVVFTEGSAPRQTGMTVPIGFDVQNYEKLPWFKVSNSRTQKGHYDPGVDAQQDECEK